MNAHFDLLISEFRARHDALAQAALSNPALTPKEQHLLLLAQACAIISLDYQLVERYVQGALDHGATEGEILEVSMLVATLPIHACTEGMPALADAEYACSEPTAPTLTGDQAKARDSFVSARGYWSDFWTQLLTRDPDFFRAYTEFSSLPWESGQLEPHFKELVYLAFDASAHHLYRPGIEIHAANALRLGASPAKVGAVFTLLSTSGSVSVDLVVAALARVR